MVVLAALRARTRGWEPSGSYRMGAWGIRADGPSSSRARTASAIAADGGLSGSGRGRAVGGGTVTPPAGGLVPQGRVTVGDRTGRFDDVVGRGFALITDIDVTAVLSPEQRGFLDELGCRIVHLGHDVIDDDGVHTTYLRELGALAYLARPDFVLFGAAADPTELTALVDELRTTLAWSAAPSAVGA